MAFGNLNLVEILKQFTRGQKLFVLIFTLAIISLTTVATTYFTTQCSEIKDVNAVLREDIIKLKESIQTCQTYNETLIQNNLLIIEKTNELHLKLLGNSSILESRSLTVIPDSIDVEDLKTVQLLPSPSDEDDADKLLHEILDLAKNK